MRRRMHGPTPSKPPRPPLAIGEGVDRPVPCRRLAHGVRERWSSRDRGGDHLGHAENLGERVGEREARHQLQDLAFEAPLPGRTRQGLRRHRRSHRLRRRRLNVGDPVFGVVMKSELGDGAFGERATTPAAFAPTFPRVSTLPPPAPSGSPVSPPTMPSRPSQPSKVRPCSPPARPVASASSPSSSSKPELPASLPPPAPPRRWRSSAISAPITSSTTAATSERLFGRRIRRCRRGAALRRRRSPTRNPHRVGRPARIHPRAHRRPGRFTVVNSRMWCGRRRTLRGDAGTAQPRWGAGCAAAPLPGRPVSSQLEEA